MRLVNYILYKTTLAKVNFKSYTTKTATLR
jgi:hypothetical protein